MKCFASFVFSCRIAPDDPSLASGPEQQSFGSVILEGIPHDSGHLRTIEKAIRAGLNKSNDKLEILAGPTIISYSVLPPEGQNGTSPLVIPGRGKIQPARR